MSFLGTLESIAKGATTGVIVLTALPIFGTVGTITTAGIVVGSLVGSAAALADQLTED